MFYFLVAYFVCGLDLKWYLLNQTFDGHIRKNDFRPILDLSREFFILC